MDEVKNVFPVKWEFSGDFADRAELLWQRLHTDGIYSPEAFFHPAGYGWQGDFEGRTLLAWALLGRLLGKTSPFLKPVMEAFPQKVNAQGFFGEFLDPEAINEQQLAGHGWLLRAMAEQFINTGDSFFADGAKNILNNLVVPVIGKIAEYPVSDGMREAAGEASGSSDRKIGRWQVSTDIGAVFILLDGALQASDVFQIPLGTLPQDMITIFRKINLRKMRMQTHATLSFLRAVIRCYEKTRDKELLDYAEELFGFYRQFGMTENYANDNWFERPEWTEPCAVIDSFMVAMDLARLTGKADYLDSAHRIWFSGVEAGQRNSGGMGCDTCLHDDQPLLQVRYPEATWCCTMRGGEGFYACGSKALMLQGNTLLVNLPLSGRYTFADGLTIEVTAAYPEAASVTVKIIAQAGTAVENIRIFTVENGWENGNVAHGEYPTLRRKTRSGRADCFWRGPLMMGRRENSRELVPVNSNWKLSMDELKQSLLKMIFDGSDI